MVKDGLKTNEFWVEDLTLSDDISGASISLDGVNALLTGSITLGGNISGVGTANFSTAASSGKLLSAAGTGSPTNTWGKLVQAGTGDTGAGSAAWHTFPTAFTSVPIVVSGWMSGGNWIFTGSRVAGSFFTVSEDPSQPFTWVAIG